jgi:hypothetical protein
MDRVVRMSGQAMGICIISNMLGGTKILGICQVATWPHEGHKLLMLLSEYNILHGTEAFCALPVSFVQAFEARQMGLVDKAMA